MTARMIRIWVVMSGDASYLNSRVRVNPRSSHPRAGLAEDQPRAGGWTNPDRSAKISSERGRKEFRPMARYRHLPPSGEGPSHLSARPVQYVHQRRNPMRTSALKRSLAALCLTAFLYAGFVPGAPCPVVRAEQGPVPEVRLQDHEDPAFRHLFLSPGRVDGQNGRAHGRTLVLAPVPDVQPRAQGPPAPDPLREQPRVPADDGHLRAPRRGDRRRHRIVQAPDHPALRRLALRDRPRHRPRARPRLPVRPDGPGPFRRAPGATKPACASRSGSSRAWPNTCPSGRSIRTRPCG